MRRAAHLDDFLREPVGRYLAGATWLYGCPRAALYTTVLHGRPARADAETLAAALAGELAAGVPPHRSLIDARRVEGVDPGAFDVLSAYVRRHHATLARAVTRLALVRPAGMEGAVVAGFYRVLDPPYPVQLFEDAPAALAWLGEPPAIAAALDDAFAAETGTQPLVGALRAVLARELAGVTFGGACRALGVSTRTLQRRLRDAGTTFQRELAAARLRDAQRRMLASDDSLTAIALECGFASLQHLSTLFRKTTGLSPSEWRAANRR
jgi:AraC-like DNA-binding protein